MKSVHDSIMATMFCYWKVKEKDSTMKLNKRVTNTHAHIERK